MPAYFPVVPMMQFEKEQLCDFTAEPGPKQPRYGAGQVHKYRKRKSFGRSYWYVG